jgi:hypothetical protein
MSMERNATQLVDELRPAIGNLLAADESNYLLRADTVARLFIQLDRLLLAGNPLPESWRKSISPTLTSVVEEQISALSDLGDKTLKWMENLLDTDEKSE